MSIFVGYLFVILISSFFSLLLNFVWRFVDMLRGGHGQQGVFFRANNSSQRHTNQHNTRAGESHNDSARRNSRQRRRGKIFSKEEGEYVDFEEV